MSGSHRPTGTVTFLFTDIEGSTRLWEQHPDLMEPAHHRQEAILLDAVRAHGGYPYKMTGDAFQVAFGTAAQALHAAFDAQRALHSEAWGDLGDLRVRMAIHTGVTEEREGDYTGAPLNRIARLMSAGHGGQILLSLATQELVRDYLPPGVTLKDMGEHRLNDLTRPEHIFQLAHPDLPSDFPPLKTLDARPNNIPLQPTPFIGRDKEVNAIGAKLLGDDIRLLTLTGPGGIGKTRLALQAVAELLDDFKDGVFFANLAPLSDPDLVIPTIAQTLGLSEAGGQPIADILREYLQSRQVLLLLDNFEHLPIAARLVADLLKSAPQLKVLATSRASLRLTVEHEYAVPPLQVPDLRKLPLLEEMSQYEAVALFIARAQAVKPDFALNNQNAPSVAEICVRLDGLPLAVELAAARAKILSPNAILDRLANRLKLLTGGGRDAPSRQQALRNTIDWSHGLLTPDEQKLFRRMSVFVGGCTLEAAEAVCNATSALEADMLDGVTSLVDNSLLYTAEGADGEARYWMLQTIQEYAQEKLSECVEVGEIMREHALYFMRLTEEGEIELRGAKQAEWLTRLEDEHDNIRAALRWAMEYGERDNTAEGGAGGAIEIGLRIAGALWRFWYVRGYFSEGRERLAGVLGAEAFHSRPTHRPYRAKALNGEGNLADMQGDHQAARSLYEESLAIRRELGDTEGVARTLNNLGVVALEQGDYQAARSLYEESLVISRDLGDKEAIARALNNFGSVALGQGDYQTARSLYEEGLTIMRGLGDKEGIAQLLNNLGQVALGQGDYQAARSLHDESLTISRELGDKWGIARSLSNLGQIALGQGDYQTAGSLYEESLIISRELGGKQGIASSLAGLGGMSVGIGSVAETGVTREHVTERGARLLGSAAALLESIGAVLDRTDLVPYEQSVISARRWLGEEAFKKAWEGGRDMTMERAIAYALEGS